MNIVHMVGGKVEWNAVRMRHRKRQTKKDYDYPPSPKALRPAKRGRSGKGKHHGDGRAFVESRLDIDFSAMGINDAADDGQAKASPAGFIRAEHGTKSPPADFFAHAGAGVGKIHHRIGCAALRDG